jgi:hypothetical protein
MELAGAQKDVAEYTTNGVDTSWGSADLKTFAIFTVPDLTLPEIREYTDLDQTVSHRPEILGKTRYKIDYAALVSAPILAALRDRTVRVDVDRVSAPLATTAIVPFSAAVAVPIGE